MLAWRLCSSRYVDTAFTGRGAYIHGGRWNPAGVPVVYTSSTRALAALELLVHLGDSPIPAGFVVIPVEIPLAVTVEVVAVRALPPDWRDYPAPASLQRLGAEWVRQGAAVALAVPSVIVPDELNYLLNPAHPDFPVLGIGDPQPFELDPRLREDQAV